MSEAQVDLLLFLVVGMTAAMAILTVFVIYLANHPPPKRWRLGGRDEDDEHEDSDSSR